MALVATLAEFKAWLNRADATDDTELTTVLTAASLWVEWRIGGPLTVTGYTETLRCANGWAIIPSKKPLATVTSITWERTGSSALDATAYKVDTDANLIRFYWGVQAGWYVVVYTAGLASIPDRVKTAGLEVARHLWLVQNGSSGRGFPGDEMPTPLGFAIPRRAEELLVPNGPVMGFA